MDSSTTFFQKLKRFFGFAPENPYHYELGQDTHEVAKVPESEPVVEEPVVDIKDGNIDLTSMTKPDLMLLARARGLTVTNRMKKQEIINVINTSV